MKTKSWFEVSREGLRELQEDKPKHYILRELVQNSWDEAITKCSVSTKWEHGRATIIVSDDSPEGFRDITHAFTLFAPTYKRSDPEKRGRYNIGEKMILALCDEAKIETTKGTLIFDKLGRHAKKAWLKYGSTVTLVVRMTIDEYMEMLKAARGYLVPKNIVFSINGEVILYRVPSKVFEAVLPTEFEKSGIFRRTQRKTSVDVHIPQGDAWLYEMGLPVTEIDCKYSIDVQQKVPLSVDRDTVPQSFLSVLYAEVLNATYDDLESAESSQVWIRDAAGNKRVDGDAVRAVISKRYGDKVVVATPGDKRSVDEAISHGYKVVYGPELSKEEWFNIGRAEAIPPSSELFGTTFAESVAIRPTEDMLRFAGLAKRIAKRCLGLDIGVRFAMWNGVAAQYGLGILTLNVKKLGDKFFSGGITHQKLALILHELAHEAGLHTEHVYHEKLTEMAGKLIITALKEPKFFEDAKA